MYHSPAIEEARRFIEVVWDGSAPSDEALTAALDRLVAAYHSAPEELGPGTDQEPPRQAYEELWQQTATRFPDLGLYPVCDLSGPIDQSIMMADAVDDLVDLTLDMREVIWLADHVGADEAHGFLRFMFFHWGEHARGLASFLHARQFG